MLIEKSDALRDLGLYVVVFAKAAVDRVQNWHELEVLPLEVIRVRGVTLIEEGQMREKALAGLDPYVAN